MAASRKRMILWFSLRRKTMTEKALFRRFMAEEEQATRDI